MTQSGQKPNARLVAIAREILAVPVAEHGCTVGAGLIMLYATGLRAGDLRDALLYAAGGAELIYPVQAVDERWGIAVAVLHRLGREGPDRVADQCPTLRGYLANGGDMRVVQRLLRCVHFLRLPRKTGWQLYAGPGADEAIAGLGGAGATRQAVAWLREPDDDIVI